MENKAHTSNKPKLFHFVIKPNVDRLIDVSFMFSRYLLDYGMLHPTEKYYPLRPEFAESTFYLYQATKGVLNKPI